MANNKNSNGQYSGNNRNSGNYNNNNNPNPDRKKHSGCTYKSSDKNGNPCTIGWNYSRANGLVSFLACTYEKDSSRNIKGSNIHESPTSGRKWINVMVKVSPKLQKPFIVSGMMDASTGAVTIKELGIVMNPRAANGGYCGKFSK